jgi:hypothetical protein
MAAVIYTLCALTSFLCAWLILRSYRRNRVRLLLWSGLCFSGLFVNNVILVMDRLVVPHVDLSMIRMGSSLAAVVLLLFGLIWEEE